MQIRINEFPVPIRKADGTLSEVNLANSVSIVQNLTVTGVGTPEPTFSISPDYDCKGERNEDEIVIHVEPVLGQNTGDQRKLTFSGPGAPNGILKNGAYIVSTDTEEVGRFQCLFGARKVTKDVLIVDATQQAAFQSAFGGEIGQAKYNPTFDRDLDGSVKVTDSNEFGAAASKVVVCQ